MIHLRRLAALLMALVSLTPALAAAYEEFCDRDDFADKRVINERRLGAIRDLNKKYGKPAVPEAAAQLSGPNTFGISVIDDQTMRPVGEYWVHAVVIGHKFERMPKSASSSGLYIMSRQRQDDDWDTNPKKYLENEELLGLGRLESKRVKDAGGFCRYEGLGRVEVEFQVWAQGYGPKSLMVQIPQAGSSAVMRLTPAGAVRGRVVDSNGAPLAGVEIALHYPEANAAKHYGEVYAATTGADGCFTLDTLPPDVYTVGFPGLAHSVEDLDQKARDASSKERDKAGTLTLDEAIDKRFQAEARQRAGLIVPKMTPVDLTRAGERNLETIRLEKSPTLDLTIIDAQGAPMDSFAFQLAYIDENGEMPGHYSGRVNPDGKTSLTLAGWQAGQDVAVFAPSIGSYQLRSIQARRRPNPLLTISGGEYYTLQNDERYHYTERYDQVRAETGNDEEPEFTRVPWPEQYEALTPERKAKVRGKLAEIQENLKKAAAGQAALPEHPNALLFTPRPGESSMQRLALKPTTDTLSLRLLALDRATGQPVPGFTGLFMDHYNPGYYLSRPDLDKLQFSNDGRTRLFRATGPSGRATLTAIQLSNDYLGRERMLAAAHPRDEGRERLERELTMGVVIAAPGYVRQGFEITHAQFRAGKELVFELEPEAVVRGRVLLGETGEPLTTTALHTLLRCHGKPLAPPKFERFSDFPALLERELSVRFSNLSLESDNREQNSNDHFAKFSAARLDREGRFEIRGLRPDPYWSCTLEARGIPPYNRSGIALQPGVNELEDILVGAPGGLILKVADAEGRPLTNVWLDLPLEASDFKTTTTDAAGELRLDMRPLSVDRQIVNLCPPWGHEAKLDEYADKRIIYAAEKELPRTAINTLTPHLARGHALLVEIPRSALRDDLARFYAAESAAFVYYNPRQRRPDSFIGLCWAVLQALEPGTDGFTYHQKKGFMEGIRFTSDTMTLRLENVPPGRHALRLDWGLYVEKSNEYAFDPRKRGVADGAGQKLPQETSYDCMDSFGPFAYTELLMPDTTATLKLELNDADVEITLKDLPTAVVNAKGPWYNGLLNTVAFLEREKPLSFIHSGSTRMILARALANVTRTPEALTMPMVSYFMSFELKDAGAGKTVCPPVRFRALAPGTYRLQVYADVQTAPGWVPYYETTLKVGRNPGKIQLAVPYEAPKKYEPLRPVGR